MTMRIAQGPETSGQRSTSASGGRSAGGFHSTRMDNNLRSVIDHILVNNSVQNHIPDTEADIFLPGGGDSTTFGNWRRTFSDHFPLTFRIEIENQDDDVDFDDDPGP